MVRDAGFELAHNALKSRVPAFRCNGDCNNVLIPPFGCIKVQRDENHKGTLDSEDHQD
jgi:hypothetical protein